MCVTWQMSPHTGFHFSQGQGGVKGGHTVLQRLYLPQVGLVQQVDAGGQRLGHLDVRGAQSLDGEAELGRAKGGVARQRACCVVVITKQQLIS